MNDDDLFYLDDDAPDCAACRRPVVEHGAYPPYPPVAGQACDGYVWPVEQQLDLTA